MVLKCGHGDGAVKINLHKHNTCKGERLETCVFNIN